MIVLGVDWMTTRWWGGNERRGRFVNKDSHWLTNWLTIPSIDLSIQQFIDSQGLCFFLLSPYRRFLDDGWMDGGEGTNDRMNLRRPLHFLITCRPLPPQKKTFDDDDERCAGACPPPPLPSQVTFNRPLQVGSQSNPCCSCYSCD